jgi:hypothetical protein
MECKLSSHLMNTHPLPGRCALTSIQISHGDQKDVIGKTIGATGPTIGQNQSSDSTGELP